MASPQRFMVTASISGGAMQTQSTTFSPYLDIRYQFHQNKQPEPSQAVVQLEYGPRACHLGE